MTSTREAERRRVIAMLLAEVGRLRLQGKREAADALDEITLRVEHPEAA